MAILRVGQAQLALQPQLPGGGVQQVAAPHHLGDALKGVVYHHRQLIGVYPVGAAEDKVPALRRQVLGIVPLNLVPEGDRLLRHLNAPGGGALGRERLPLCRGEMAAAARVQHHPVRPVGGGGGQPLGPGAEAGIDQPLVLQGAKGGGIGLGAPALIDGLAVPVQAQPL